MIKPIDTKQSIPNYRHVHTQGKSRQSRTWITINLRQSESSVNFGLEEREESCFTLVSVLEAWSCNTGKPLTTPTKLEGAQTTGEH